VPGRPRDLNVCTDASREVPYALELHDDGNAESNSLADPVQPSQVLYNEGVGVYALCSHMEAKSESGFIRHARCSHQSLPRGSANEMAPAVRNESCLYE
jgi:hypothetical protein